MSSSQRSPKNPVAQRHSYVLGLSMQSPPFKQGLDLHSFISEIENEKFQNKYCDKEGFFESARNLSSKRVSKIMYIKFS